MKQDINRIHLLTSEKNQIRIKFEATDFSLKFLNDFIASTIFHNTSGKPVLRTEPEGRRDLRGLDRVNVKVKMLQNCLWCTVYVYPSSPETKDFRLLILNSMILCSTHIATFHKNYFAIRLNLGGGWPVMQLVSCRFLAAVTPASRSKVALQLVNCRFLTTVTPTPYRPYSLLILNNMICWYF